MENRKELEVRWEVETGEKPKMITVRPSKPFNAWQYEANNPQLTVPMWLMPFMHTEIQKGVVVLAVSYRSNDAVDWTLDDGDWCILMPSGELHIINDKDFRLVYDAPRETS